MNVAGLVIQLSTGTPVMLVGFAAQLEAATTTEARRAVVNQALEWIDGYLCALRSHERALAHTSAPHMAQVLGSLEEALMAALAMSLDTADLLRAS